MEHEKAVRTARNSSARLSYGRITHSYICSYNDVISYLCLHITINQQYPQALANHRSSMLASMTFLLNSHKKGRIHRDMRDDARALQHPPSFLTLDDSINCLRSHPVRSNSAGLANSTWTQCQRRILNSQPLHSQGDQRREPSTRIPVPIVSWRHWKCNAKAYNFIRVHDNLESVSHRDHGNVILQLLA
jgi:hypothetical protein